MPNAEDVIDSQVIDPELDDTDGAEDTAATDETDDSDDASPPPTPDPRVARLERSLTRMGRRNSEAEQSARQATAALAQTQQELQSLRTQMDQVGKTLSTQEQQRTQAYLDSLPTEQRALAEVELLKRQIAGMGQPRTQTQTRQAAPPANQQQSGEDAVAYAKRRSQEILDDIFDQTNIELDGTEDGIDWTDERTFSTSAAAVARTLMKTGGTMAKKKTTTDDEETDDSGAAPRANRPMSAKANPPARRRGTPATPEEFNSVFAKYDSKLGPKAMRKQLEKLRS